jgi:hypothetical protein
MVSIVLCCQLKAQTHKQLLMCLTMYCISSRGTSSSTIGPAFDDGMDTTSTDQSVTTTYTKLFWGTDLPTGRGGRAWKESSTAATSKWCKVCRALAGMLVSSWHP